MRLACIAFVFGAWVLQQQAVLPDVAVLLALAGAAALALVLVRVLEASRRDAQRASHAGSAGAAIRIAIALIAWTVIGFAWAAFRADARLAQALPPDVEGRDVSLTGTIATLPYVWERGVRFEFEVERVDAPDVHVPRRLALAWYSGWGRDAGDSAPVPRVAPGERWRLSVRMKRPHGAANPDGFDYEYWLLEEGVRATGYVRVTEGDSVVDNRRLDPFVLSFDHAVERARAVLRDRIMAVLTDDGAHPAAARYAGVIVALVVGDQRAIAQSDWQVFNRTGIGHLVSISGLHVTMLASLGAWLAFALWRKRPAWAARLPAHKAAALAGASVALVYCLLAGFGVPAQRTLYMIGMVALALWTGRMTSVSRVLCAALILVVAIDPWAVMGAGFWLSFCAVAAIFYVTSGRIETPLAHDADWRERLAHTLRIAARVQWAVTLGLVPLTMLLFHQVSLASPFANAIAIPLVSFVVTPLSLAGAILPGFVGAALLHAAHGLIAMLASLLTAMSNFPFAVWSGAAPSAWVFVCAALGTAWLLAPRGVPARWAGALWLVPLFAWPPDRPEPGSVRFTALDVGQGMAVLIETHHSTTLYDTGPQYSPDNDSGNRIILPYLRARGIARLDAMIVSHNDSDHSGGALSILQAVPVAQLESSLTPDSAIVRAARSHRRCVSGQRWTADGVVFEMVHPLPEIYAAAEGKSAVKPNAKSCVLRVVAGKRAMLLAGDIERPQELELRARSTPDALRADVLLVPHHGSMTSSSELFLDAVQPDIAVVQSGYRNRFGHPRAEILARYAARGVKTLRNDDGGAITIIFDETGVRIEAYRVTHSRYWYGR